MCEQILLAILLRQIKTDCDGLSTWVALVYHWWGPPTPLSPHDPPPWPLRAPWWLMKVGADFKFPNLPRIADAACFVY